MNIRRRLKRDSRRMLKGMWGKGAVLSAVAFLISAVLIGAEDLLGQMLELSYFADPRNTPGNYLDNTPSLSLAALLLFLGSVLLSFLLSAPLRLGSKRWYLHLTAGDPKPLIDAFSYYRKPLPFLRAAVFEAQLSLRKALLTAVCFLPALLLYLALPTLEQLAIPSFLFFLLVALLLLLFSLMGAVFSLLWSGRYFLAEYLYTLYGCRMRDAVKLSVIIMRGRKTHLLSLMLSFLPLYLTDLLILPRLWTVPRRNAAFARYAQYFTEAYEQAKEKAAPKHTPDEAERFATREFPCVS